MLLGKVKTADLVSTHSRLKAAGHYAGTTIPVGRFQHTAA